MPMPKHEIQKEMNEAWNTYVEALEKSLDMIETDAELNVNFSIIKQPLSRKHEILKTRKL